MHDSVVAAAAIPKAAPEGVRSMGNATDGPPLATTCPASAPPEATGIAETPIIGQSAAPAPCCDVGPTAGTAAQQQAAEHRVSNQDPTSASLDAGSGPRPAASASTSATAPLPAAEHSAQPTSDPPGAAHGTEHAGIPVLPSNRRDARRELPLECQIAGCGLSLASQAEYYQRYRICRDHLRAAALVVDGVAQRFCQQCGRFHLLEEFDGSKRNCRARLAQHNSRRRKATTPGERRSDECRRYSSAGLSLDQEPTQDFAALDPGSSDAALRSWASATAAATAMTDPILHQLAGSRRAREDYEGGAFGGELPLSLRQRTGPAPSQPPAHLPRFFSEPSVGSRGWAQHRQQQHGPSSATLAADLTALLGPSLAQAVMQNAGFPLPQPPTPAVAPPPPDARSALLQMLSSGVLQRQEVPPPAGGLRSGAVDAAVAGRTAQPAPGSAFLRPHPVRAQQPELSNLVPTVPRGGFAGETNAAGGLAALLAALAAPPNQHPPASHPPPPPPPVRNPFQEYRHTGGGSGRGDSVLLQLLAAHRAPPVDLSHPDARPLEELFPQLKKVPPQYQPVPPQQLAPPPPLQQQYQPASPQQQAPPPPLQQQYQPLPPQQQAPPPQHQPPVQQQSVQQQQQQGDMHALLLQLAQAAVNAAQAQAPPPAQQQQQGLPRPQQQQQPHPASASQLSPALLRQLLAALNNAQPGALSAMSAGAAISPPPPAASAQM